MPEGGFKPEHPRPAAVAASQGPDYFAATAHDNRTVRSTPLGDVSDEIARHPCGPAPAAGFRDGLRPPQCDPRSSPRHRQGGLRLRLPDGGQLPDPVRLLRGFHQPRIQGAVEPAEEHPSRLHPGRQGGADSQLRHALLHARPRPAHRAVRAHRAADREGALLQHPAGGRLHLQLRLHRQSRDGQRRRHLHDRRTALDRRQAGRCRRRDPSGNRVRYRDLSDPALQPRRSRQRHQDPGRLQGPAPFGVPRPAGAGRRTGHRVHHAAHARLREDLRPFLPDPGFPAPVLPCGFHRDGAPGPLCERGHRAAKSDSMPTRSRPT